MPASTTIMIHLPSSGFRAGYLNVCKDASLPGPVRSHLSAALNGQEKADDSALQVHVLRYLQTNPKVTVSGAEKTDPAQVWIMGFGLKSTYSSVTATIEGVKGYSYNARIDA